ncbi:MAG: RsmE family RNA methyltransferase [Acidobacteriota bacterium]|nr:RsmE family RNA methyltransferase [Acidobacteriota bacterium]
MARRFYAPNLAGLGVPVLLSDAESAHLRRVLRTEAGDTVAVFDGRGGEYWARVEQVDAAGVLIRPIQPADHKSEARVALTVAPALLKGRKFDDVVRDLTMVGAVVVQPLVTARTEGKPRDATRWTRIAVASAKQCGRAVVPEVRNPCSFHSFVAHDASAVRLLLVEPSASDHETAIRALEREPRPSTATLVVGPEGGWTPEEITTAVNAGFRALTLGRLTLRADAVGVSAVSILQYVWGDV